MLLLQWKQKRWSSSRSNTTKYKKLIVSKQNESHTLFLTSQLILIKRGKEYIVWGIFINYRELHDNYQHSSDYKFRRTVDLFQRETYRRRWFPTFTLEWSRVRNKDLKMVRSFSGNETSESFKWRAWGENLIRMKFDSNERFWQMFTKVKIRKQKLEYLKNLKYCLELQKRILNVYKSWIKTNIKYYFYLTQQYAYFN